MINIRSGSLQTSSCPRRHPVIAGANDRIESARRTGSSAFADDDRSRAETAGRSAAGTTPHTVIAGSVSDEAIHSFRAAWIDSRSRSSGAHSRDPLARNDDKRKRPPGFPDGLSCPTAAPHSRAISGHLRRGSAPSRILIGCRCTSGQSRTAARTVAMVSHLRKMID
jgi:hypothetical protein